MMKRPSGAPMLARMRRLNRFVVLTVAALVVVAPSLAEPGAAFARRGRPTILSRELVLVPSRRSIVLCQDEEAGMSIQAYEKIVYQNPGDPPSRRRTGNRFPQAPFRLDSSLGNPSVASITPPFQNVGQATAFTAIVTIRGDELGTTTIEFRDTLGIARAVTVTVHTIECDIKLTSTSSWSMDFNYPLSAWARMDEVTLKRTAPNQYEGKGTLTNFASASSIGGCVPRYTVPSSRVTVSAQTFQDRSSGVVADRVRITLEYDWVTFKFPVTCLILPGQGSARGKPSRTDFETQSFTFRKVVVPKRHSMITERGSFAGDSQFVVWTEEVVPPPPP